MPLASRERGNTSSLIHYEAAMVPAINLHIHQHFCSYGAPVNIGHRTYIYTRKKTNGVGGKSIYKNLIKSVYWGWEESILTKLWQFFFVKVTFLLLSVLVRGISASVFCALFSYWFFLSPLVFKQNNYCPYGKHFWRYLHCFSIIKNKIKKQAALHTN